MATTVGNFEDRSVSIGRTFNRAFATIASNPATMFGIAFLFSALPGLIISYFSQSWRASAMRSAIEHPGVFGATMLVSLVTGVLTVVFAMLTQGALVRATVAHSEGQRASFAESVTTGLRAAVPLFILAVAMGIALAIGFVLLIVPGVILYLMWSVAAPALVAERRGVFDAFGRSQDLTSGARWKILGLELVVLIFYWIVGAVMGVLIVTTYGLQGLAGMAAQGLPFWYLIVTALVNTVIATVWAAIQTSLYVELRNWKDGPQTEALADIFA
jgi:hypothetical protein